MGIKGLIWSANHMAASQCIYRCRHGQDDLLNIRMGKKDDFSEFDLVGYWDFPTQ